MILSKQGMYFWSHLFSARWITDTFHRVQSYFMKHLDKNTVGGFKDWLVKNFQCSILYRRNCAYTHTHTHTSMPQKQQNGRIVTNCSILTLNIIVSTTPSKDINWWAGLKRKAQQAVAYKKPILSTETKIGLGWKGRKRFSKQIAPQNRKDSYIW
jgi:hypothetical protein